MKGDQLVGESVGDAVDRDRLFSDGANVNVLAWNVTGLNCPNNRGDVKWVLRTFACDVAILQESKLEVVSHPIAISLWGHRRFEWLTFSGSLKEALLSFGILKSWS